VTADAGSLRGRLAFRRRLATCRERVKMSGFCSTSHVRF
jgi:hypothetical protein